MFLPFRGGASPLLRAILRPKDRRVKTRRRESALRAERSYLGRIAAALRRAADRLRACEGIENGAPHEHPASFETALCASSEAVKVLVSSQYLVECSAMGHNWCPGSSRGMG
jgi:hypothetical protein